MDFYKPHLHPLAIVTTSLSCAFPPGYPQHTRQSLSIPDIDSM